MAFFFLWYLVFVLEIFNFSIMQIWSLMTSPVVQVQWCDTKLRIYLPIMKQCYWNLAGTLHLTKYTRWYTFWCCCGNMLGSSLLPLINQIQWNPALRPPRQYDHLVITVTLFWPEKKLGQSFSYVKNPFHTTIPLIRPVFHGPKVVVLTGFHCTTLRIDIH